MTQEELSELVKARAVGKERLITAAREISQSAFAELGEICPTIYFYEGGKVVVVIATPFTTDAVKDAFAQGLYALRRLHAHVIYVSEAWVAEVPKGADVQAMRPSEHPDRREVVMLMYYGQPDVEMWWAPILRPADAKPLLGSWERMDEAGSNIGGRMVDPPPSAMN
jgi:hypothetical protein